MPKRTDLKSILIIGAGPIVIGQACEFDYSGAQACKALRQEGYKVILVNSNPATIMTDPEMADVTYIEPITWTMVEKIIAKEKPDAILPTMGGQTALNCALDLHKHGVLAKHGVEMIGANEKAIEKAEDRLKFKDAMTSIGLDSAKSGIAHSWEEAQGVQKHIATLTGGPGFPVVIRPSFTLGGTGGGIAYNPEEFEEICKRGLDLSPTKELLIEESLIGWKEFEMEVVRDKADNCIIVCSIENLDPMGIHTGDSITVAPAQTLTDKEYQLMRNASIAILREIGVDTGGSNVQFAIHPGNGRMIVIEMNPRVSRSSALASKATGFPIAKIAAKLAVGYTLDELRNDITGGATPASFEPSIDYVVTKIPRFAFEKFREADPHLTTQMKCVGEVMAIGRTFQESFQKALRGLETGIDGLSERETRSRGDRRGDRQRRPGTHPVRRRRVSHRHEPRRGARRDRHRSRGSWRRSRRLVAIERQLAGSRAGEPDRRRAALPQAEGLLRSAPGQAARHPPARGAQGAPCACTCGRSTSASTPAPPSSRRRRPTCTAPTTRSARPSRPRRKKIMVLGGGPNRIGQGIEFDYCCVHAALAMREDGYETIMVNCNPETVSTDYDTSDRLYFEPVTLEDVLEIVDKEKPAGVIVQFGGQTPLKLALDLERAGVPIIGTTPDSIDIAEDRERFQKLLHELKLKQPPNRTARTEEAAITLAHEIGYPLVVRPSYVLGGRAMEIVHGDKDLERYMREAVRVSEKSPVLLDRFLDDAIEVDVDAVSDGSEVMIGGIMEHVEQAGVHSGDSACSLPPYSLPPQLQDELRRQTTLMAKALKVVGLMNVQFAIQGEVSSPDDAVVYVLEVNPRASRTVPFVSKATGQPLAKIAARCMAGQRLNDQRGVKGEVIPPYFSVKEAVFPFNKFPGVDPILGPEMRSTGEVMGVGRSFGEAMLKSQLGAGSRLPSKGTVVISVKNNDKDRAVKVASDLVDLGYQIAATKGTAAAIAAAGIAVTVVNKVKDGRPHIADKVKAGEIQLVYTTVDETRTAIADSRHIRTAAIANRVTYYTTMAGCEAATEALKHQEDLSVWSLQELHAELH